MDMDKLKEQMKEAKVRRGEIFDQPTSERDRRKLAEVRQRMKRIKRQMRKAAPPKQRKKKE